MCEGDSSLKVSVYTAIICDIIASFKTLFYKCIIVDAAWEGVMRWWDVNAWHSLSIFHHWVMIPSRHHKNSTIYVVKVSSGTGRSSHLSLHELCMCGQQKYASSYIHLHADGSCNQTITVLFFFPVWTIVCFPFLTWWNEPENIHIAIQERNRHKLKKKKIFLEIPLYLFMQPSIHSPNCLSSSGLTCWETGYTMDSLFIHECYRKLRVP